jgi:sugar fermentation stimulation protein
VDTGKSKEGQIFSLIMNILKLYNTYEEAYFFERPSRFVMVLQTKKGDIIHAHVLNTGRMEEFCIPQHPFFISPQKHRMFPFKVVATTYQNNFVFLDTIKVNALFFQLLKYNLIPQFRDATHIKREVIFGNSKFDFTFVHNHTNVIVEVKSCTLCHNKLAMFPDAPTLRGQKHLVALDQLARENPAQPFPGNTFDLRESGSPPLVGGVRGGGTKPPGIFGKTEASLEIRNSCSPPPNLPHQGGGTFKSTALSLPGGEYTSLSPSRDLSTPTPSQEGNNTPLLPSRADYKTYVIFLILNASAERFMPNFHTDFDYGNLFLAAKAVNFKAFRLTFIDPVSVDLQSIQEVPIDFLTLKTHCQNKGSYLLVLENPEDITVTVGKLGNIYFQKGWYVYVGSALRALDSRIKRHQKKRKKLFWHIDYIASTIMKVKKVYPIRRLDRIESELAHALEKISDGYIEHFGSTDAQDSSHLFYFHTFPLKHRDFVNIIFNARTL